MDLSIQDQMIKHVEQWRKSGLTKKAYATHIGITRYKLDYWINKFNTKSHEGAGKPGFIEIVPSNKTQSEEPAQRKISANIPACIELTFPGGLCLKIYG